MRPSSTRRSTPSSAIVVPKALRRPRASMHAMASALLRCSFCSFRRRQASRVSIEEFFLVQSEPLNGCVDSGPFFRKKLLAFTPQQQIARARIDEHAATSLAFDQLLVHQLLIALQNREVIDPIFGRDIAHGGEGVAFLQNSVDYHRDETRAKLAVNRLTVVPLTVHQVSQIPFPNIRFLSFCPLQVDVSVHWLIALHHESPVLGMMVGVEHGHHCMLHVSVLLAT